MPEPAYTHIDLGYVADDDEPQRPQSLLKRPGLVSIYSGARTSYQKSSELAKDGYGYMQYKFEETKEFTRTTDWKQVRKDIRKNIVPWTRGTIWPVTWYSIKHLCILAGPVAVLTLLAFVSKIPQLAYNAEPGICRPDGSFSIQDSHWNGWSASGFFQITLHFGRLPFTSVKIIDIFWDIIVGRGLQAVFATISYQVFTRSIQRTMESSSVAYGTFQAVAFDKSSISQIIRLFINLSTNEGKRGKIQVLWMISSSIFIMAFSTLASAMTGYTSNIDAFVNFNNTLAGVGFVQPLIYTIHDYDRIGLKTPYVPAQTNSLSIASDACGYMFLTNSTGPDFSVIPSECFLLATIGYYVQNNGLNMTHSRTSALHWNHYDQNITVPLDAPTLNITSTYIDPALYYPGWRRFSHAQFRYSQYLYGGKAYSHDYINKNGECSSVIPPTYAWGFSFLLLFTSVLLSTLWSIGMYTMWLDAHLNSRYDRAGRQMGTHRAVLDFAKAMRKDMGEDAAENLSNAQLKKRVKRGMNGSRIGYEMLDDPGSGDKKLPLTRRESLRLWWVYHGWRTWSLTKKILVVTIPVVLVMLVIVTPIAVSLTSRNSCDYDGCYD